MTTLLFSLIAQIAFAGQIHVGVNGMVCAFCANGIEKTFKKEAAVEDIKVDLENKLVTIKTKDSQDLDDGKIKDAITKAGYTVTSIHREK